MTESNGSQENDPTEQEGLDDELANLARPPGRTDGSHSSVGDVLGIFPGSGNSSPLAALFEGSQNFEEWSVRGVRSLAVAIAEVEIGLENAALLSESWPIRGDHMKKVAAQRAYHNIFSQGKTGLQKLEFFGLITFGVAMFATVFLIATVYAP